MIGLVASVLLSASAAANVAAEPRGLPFITDDYARARAEARRNALPLFVEVWAPW